MGGSWFVAGQQERPLVKGGNYRKGPQREIAEGLFRGEMQLRGGRELDIECSIDHIFGRVHCGHIGLVSS